MDNFVNNNKIVNALTAAAISSNTTTSGVAVDTQGYQGATFVLDCSAYTDGTYTPNIQESDVSGSGYTDVSDAFLTNLESTAAVSAKDGVKAIGVLQHKRYLRVQLVSTGVSSGATLLARALLHNPRHLPVA